MKYKALLLDFYGTLVAEDDDIIREILLAIAACSPVSSDMQRIGRDWRFQEMCRAAHGDHFKLQRAVEIESLANLVSDYEAELDPQHLAERLFAYWQAPRVFEDAAWFLQNNALPVCVVSNIDTHDLLAASAHAGWHWEHIVTSESCRSYKPRAEMFLRALDRLSCKPGEVLHIGDSLSSDVAGAQQLGIDVAWVNRKNRTLPSRMPAPTFTVTNLKALAVQGIVPYVSNAVGERL
jgi:2-haloalkanoic acid dehalogenase type II